MTGDRVNPQIPENQKIEPNQGSDSALNREILLAYAPQVPKEAAKRAAVPAKAAEDFGTIPLGLFPTTDIGKLPDKSKIVKYEEEEKGVKVQRYKFEDSGKIPGQNIDYTTTWRWSADKKLLNVETLYREAGAKESGKGLDMAPGNNLPDYARKNIAMVVIQPTINDGRAGYFRQVFSYPTKDDKTGDYLTTETNYFVGANGKAGSSGRLIDEGDPRIPDDDYKATAIYHKTVARFAGLRFDEEAKQLMGSDELKGETKYNGSTGEILLDSEFAKDGKPIKQTAYNYNKSLRSEIAHDADGNPSIRTEYGLNSNEVVRLVEYAQNENSTVMQKETKYNFLGDGRNLVTDFNADGTIGLTRAIAIPGENGEPDKVERLYTYLPDTKQITIESFDPKSLKLITILTLGPDGTTDPDGKANYRTESIKIASEGATVGEFQEINYKDDGTLPFIISGTDAAGNKIITGINGKFKTKFGKEVPLDRLNTIFTNSRKSDVLQTMLKEIQKK